MSAPPDTALFLGRFHPVLVHLPIGLLVLLAATEFLGRFPRFKSLRANAGFIVAVAAPLAVITAVCGWLLSLGGGYDDRILRLHKWTGIGTAAICVLAAILYRMDWKPLYRVLVYAGVIVLAISSHFGGSLTHGSSYLVQYAPWRSRPPAVTQFAGKTGRGSDNGAKPVGSRAADRTSTPVFAAVVAPILDDKCVACHGPEKSKGRLRLDSFEALSKGGENGQVIVAGKSADSDLVKRLLLPVESDDHMPPDGKPQPNADDITLIRWWIDSGAPEKKTVAELSPTPVISRIISERLGAGVAQPQAVASAEASGSVSKVAAGVAPLPATNAAPLAAKIADDLGLPMTFLGEDQPWLQINASVQGTNFADADLAKLGPVALNLRWLDLAGTGITDDGLAHLASMSNLTKLSLQRTAVTDDGLAHLTKLAQLEYLNLYGTQVTDAGLKKLEALPRLKHLYLWQTKVTPQAVSNFTDVRVDKQLVVRLQQELEQLKARIKDQEIYVDLGVTSSATATNTSVAGTEHTNAATTAGATTPINTVCPVSGKPVDASKTSLYSGHLVAFCCDDCKAKFEQDPKPFLDKLNIKTAAR